MAKGKTKNTPHQKGHPKQKRSQDHAIQSKWYADALGLALIIFLGILIYSNSFTCSFHLDDASSIVENLKIRNLSNVKELWNYSSTRFIPYYTFAVNYHFGELNVWGYHLFNLVIHLANACLVYWLTVLIFSSPALKDQSISKDKKVIAFFTALLFVSHPLATQSVTYIVQRLASMVTLFFLLSLALYVKARLSDWGNPSKYLMYAASFISAVLAMLTKENAFTLPLAILLFEILFLRTNKYSIRFKEYRVILLIAAFAGVTLFVLNKYSFSIFKPVRPYDGIEYTITSLQYLYTQFSVIVKYVQLLFLPLHQNLDYDYPIVNTFFEVKTMLSFLFLLSMILFAIFFYKKYSVFSFGIIWFLLTLSIESSVIPLRDFIFEHRTYLPSFGFFLMLSSGIYVLLWNKHKYMAIVLFVLIIGSNSVLAYERNKVWKDNFSLWSDVVSKSPNKARPLNNLGFAYSKLDQWDQAIAYYTRSIEMSPNYTRAYTNRGVAYINIGKLDKAIADYTRAIEINPRHDNAYANRGIAYGRLKHWEKAIADYSKVIEIDPKFPRIYSNRAAAFINLGQWEKAIEDYNKEIVADPDYASAYSNRGLAYKNLGQLDMAIADYDKAIEIDNNYGLVYSNRGNIYVQLKQWEKAIADYSRAIAIDPKFTNAYFNRGVTYGNLGQWDNAIADYSKTIELDSTYSSAYANRTIAYRNLRGEKKQ